MSELFGVWYNIGIIIAIIASVMSLKIIVRTIEASIIVLKNKKLILLEEEDQRVRESAEKLKQRTTINSPEGIFVLFLFIGIGLLFAITILLDTLLNSIR